MSSYSEYYRKRLENQKICLQEFASNLKKTTPIIIGRKRKYEEAMGYQNDYLVVQEPQSIQQNKGCNWIDAYLENLSNYKK